MDHAHKKRPEKTSRITYLMYENLTLVADLDAGMIGQYVWISMSTRGHMTKKTLEKQVQKRNGVHKTRSAQNYKETKKHFNRYMTYCEKRDLRCSQPVHQAAGLSEKTGKKGG